MLVFTKSVIEFNTYVYTFDDVIYQNSQGDLFRGLGFRVSGGGGWSGSGGLVWLLSYLCRVEVPCLARASGTFKNARFGIIPRCRPKLKITIQ